MAAPVLISATGFQTTNQSNPGSVNVDSHLANFIGVFVGWYQDSTSVHPTVTDAVGANNNGVPTEVAFFSSTNRRISFFYWKNPAFTGVTHTITITPVSAQNQYVAGAVQVVSGADTTTPIDSGATQGQGDNTGAVNLLTNFTPTNDNELWLSASSNDIQFTGGGANGEVINTSGWSTDVNLAEDASGIHAVAISSGSKTGGVGTGGVATSVTWHGFPNEQAVNVIALVGAAAAAAQAPYVAPQQAVYRM